MFKTLYQAFALKKENVEKKKNNTVSNLCIEVFYYASTFIRASLQKLSVTSQIIIITKPLKLTSIEKIMDKKSEKTMRAKNNKLLFYTRESFYDHITVHNFVNFIKQEWFYWYIQTLLHKNSNINKLQNYNYIREKQLFKLFNVTKNGSTLFGTRNAILQNLYWGFVSFWSGLKIWIFSLLFFSVSFYVLLIKRVAVLPQTLFFWVGASMLLYWLISGFVFFVKKYQFSRYTSVIQRFWRRSYILFWLIESGLLLVFFYLTINSSQESFYMFDQGYFLKTHLFSWKLFIPKCIIVVGLITYSYLIILNLKWNTFNKNILNLTALTALLLYLVWTEFYQIYWVSNFYANFFWLYDFEDGIWSLEWDARRTRIVNHYIMVLFLLKFWHIIFIFGCWIFFLLRSNELETITYPLYSFNFQNFIILFIMMWLFMFPWFKHTFRWIMEIPYYWFYVDTHMSFYRILVIDFINFYKSIVCNLLTTNFSQFTRIDFSDWNFFDLHHNSNVFIKSTIRDRVLESLIQN